MWVRVASRASTGTTRVQYPVRSAAGSRDCNAAARERSVEVGTPDNLPGVTVGGGAGPAFWRDDLTMSQGRVRRHAPAKQTQRHQTVNRPDGRSDRDPPGSD